MQERIRQFVQDASRVSADLDQISRRDRPEQRARAVAAGSQAYAELLEREHALTLSGADVARVQSILDGIRARLRFLS